jgi:hypothetical protein
MIRDNDSDEPSKPAILKPTKYTIGYMHLQLNELCNRAYAIP